VRLEGAQESVPFAKGIIKEYKPKKDKERKRGIEKGTKRIKKETEKKRTFEKKHLK